MGKRGVSERVREKEKDWRYRLTFVSKYAQGVSVCVYVCAYGCKCGRGTEHRREATQQFVSRHRHKLFIQTRVVRTDPSGKLRGILNHATSCLLPKPRNMMSPKP